MITQLRAGLDDGARPAGRTRRAALLELVWVETRRLLRHPFVWLGFALSAGFAWAILRGRLPVVTADVTRLAATVGPLAVGTLLATNLAILRPVRDDIEDVYGSVPVGAAVRSSAMLGASVAAGLLGILYAGAGLIYLYAIGGTGTPHLADVLAIPLLVASTGVVGVAVARWFPNAFAGPMTATVIVGIQLWFSRGAGRRPRLSFTSDWAANLNALLDLVPRDPWMHLLYVAGIATALASAAMLRHGPTRLPGFGLLAGTATAVATSLALLQPVPPERAELLLALADDPDPLSERNQCITREQVTYCTPALHHGWVDHWHPTVSAVLEAVPDQARPDSFTVRMHADIAKSAIGIFLPDQLRSQSEDILGSGRGTEDAPRSATGEILITPDQYRGTRGANQTLGLAIATVSDVLHIGGLTPTSTTPTADDNEQDGPAEETPGDELVSCTPAGQAREILALYLATLNDPTAQQALRRELELQPYALQPISDEFGGGFFLDDTLYIENEAYDASQTAQWSRSGATLALRLLDQPTEEILQRLRDHWERWTHPATTRDELLTTFRLEPLPTVEQLAQRAGTDPSQLDAAELTASASQAPTCR